MSTTKRRAKFADTHTVDEFREKAQKLIDEIAERRDALRRLIEDYSDIKRPPTQKTLLPRGRKRSGGLFWTGCTTN